MPPAPARGGAAHPVGDGGDELERVGPRVGGEGPAGLGLLPALRSMARGAGSASVGRRGGGGGGGVSRHGRTGAARPRTAEAKAPASAANAATPRRASGRTSFSEKASSSTPSGSSARSSACAARQGGGPAPRAAERAEAGRGGARPRGPHLDVLAVYELVAVKVEHLEGEPQLLLVWRIRRKDGHHKRKVLRACQRLS